MKRVLIICLAILFSVVVSGCGQISQEDKSPTWQEQYDLGIHYLSEGNYEEAIIAFTVAIEIDPKQASAYVGRGNAYLASGETEENLVAATADYETAIELDGNDLEIYIKLADLYLQQGDTDRAWEILQLGQGAAEDSQQIEDKLTQIEQPSSASQENPSQIVHLDLSNVRCTYSTTGTAVQYNDGAIGQMEMDYTVNGPSAVRDIHIGIWQETPFSQEEINSAIEMYTAVWKREGSIDSSNKSLPFDWGGCHPVYLEESGTVQYVLLIGLDASGDAVGYEIIREEIP